MPARGRHVKILLIRLRLIGDVVFTTPLLGALKRAFPDSRLTYLVERDAAPVVAGNPHLARRDRRRRARAGWRAFATTCGSRGGCARERFDVVLDLHGGPRSSWLTWATGAPQRIGYDIQGRGWQYTRTVHRPRGLQPRHSVVNQWELLDGDRRAGPAAPPDPARDPVEMPLDPAADARIAERLRAAGVGRRHEVMVVHVSAGNPFRRWPEPAFATLVAGLAAGDDRRRIVLSSGPSDRHGRRSHRRAPRGTTLGPARARQVLDFGDFDLAELRALDRAQPACSSAATPDRCTSRRRRATPVVGIYGPTLAARSAPWRDPRIPTESVEVEGLPCRPCEQRVCAPGDFRCLTRIEPETVIAAAERALAQAHASVRTHS